MQGLRYAMLVDFGRALECETACKDFFGPWLADFAVFCNVLSLRWLSLDRRAFSTTYLPLMC